MHNDEFVMREAINWIKSDEGLSLMPYKCSAGFTTIGFGRNLDANPIEIPVELLKKYGISEQGAFVILLDDVNKCVDKLSELQVFNALTPTRKAALINMCYNLGFEGLMKFKNMFKALGDDNYELATHEMLNSKWALQVPNRAGRLAAAMLTDKMPALRKV